MNFDRLRFVAERAELGEQREAILAVDDSRAAGQLPRVLRAARQALDHRIQLSLRRSDGRAPVRRHRGRRPRARPRQLLAALRSARIEAYDLSDNEMAKLHVRHLVGGHAPAAEHEILYRFEFPERPGALMRFLDSMSARLEHQPVPLPQPRRRLRPRAGRHAGAAGRRRAVPALSRRPRLRLRRRDRPTRVPDVSRRADRGAHRAASARRGTSCRATALARSRKLSRLLRFRPFSTVAVPIPASFML